MYEALDRMYQAVNQILFPGTFERNVCREKRRVQVIVVKAEGQKKKKKKSISKIVQRLQKEKHQQMAASKGIV